VILSARGLMQVTDYISLNISSTPRESNTGQLNGTSGTSGLPGNGGGGAGANEAGYEGDDNWYGVGGDGGAGGTGTSGGAGGAGGSGGSGGAGGAGGYGTPGMLKLHGSVIKAEKMSVIATGALNANSIYNGKLTMISNMDDDVLNDTQPSLVTSTTTLVRGRTSYSYIVGTSLFDTADAHPLLPNLESGPATYGLLHINSGAPDDYMPTFYNKATVDGTTYTETLPAGNPPNCLKLKVFEAGIPGQLSPFADYNQIFVVNDSLTEPFTGVYLVVHNALEIPLSPPYKIGEWDAGAGNNTGQLDPGQYWTTTIPTGTHAHLLQLPNIIDQPGDTGTFPCSTGCSFTLSCRAYSATPMIYKWQTIASGPWGDIVGAAGIVTGEALITYTKNAPIGEPYQGLYRLVLTNDAGSIISDEAFVNIYQRPFITVQPVTPQTVYPPQTATFSINVYRMYDPAPVPAPWTPFYPEYDGTISETYTWKFRPRDDSGGYPSGQTYWEVVQGPSADPPNNFSSRTLTLDGTNETNQGDYYCVVENPAGSDESEIGNLTVVNGVHVTRHPEDVSVPPGYQAIFECEAEGPDPQYQWMFSTDGTAWVEGGGSVNDHWQNIPVGENATADDPTLIIPSVGGEHEGWYLCYVYNGTSEDDHSNPAQLILDDPGITAHPQSVTRNPGQMLQLTVLAQTAHPQLSYRWQYAPLGTSTFTDIFPYDPMNPNLNSTYTVLSCQESNEGLYQVIVYNGLGASKTSNTATVIIRNPPVITKEPEDVAVNPGQPAMFTIEVESDSAVTYQWYKNDGILVDEPGHISGAQTESLQFIFTVDGDEALYSCKATNLVTTVESRHAQLLVGPPMYLDNERGGGNFYTNTALVKLGVDVHDGKTPRTYQWFRNGAPVNPSPLPVPAGADVSVYLSLYDVTAAKAGDYVCKVTDQRGTLTSDTITVTVVCHLDNTPAILGDPELMLKVCSDVIDLEVALDCAGIEPVTYVWYREDLEGKAVETVASGAGLSTLYIDPITLADSGYYYVTVEDSGTDGPFESNHIKCMISACTPVTGGFGLAALTAASALFGALALRRRKH